MRVMRFTTHWESVGIAKQDDGRLVTSIAVPHAQAAGEPVTFFASSFRSIGMLDSKIRRWVSHDASLKTWSAVQSHRQQKRRRTGAPPQRRPAA